MNTSYGMTRPERHQLIYYLSWNMFMNKWIVLGVIVMITLGSIAISHQNADAQSCTSGGVLTTGLGGGRLAAPVAISGDNVYVAWPTNDTNSGEVMFRASADGGATFGDKINLSDSPDSNSTRVEINSNADNVIVTWWETNQTDDTPVIRVSNDNGQTFGPLIRLATNGTIGGSAE